MHDFAFICPTKVYLKSVVIDYCTTTTSAHNSFWGGTHWNYIYMCYPIFVQGIICEKTFRRFQDVMLLTYSKAIFPSRISIGSTKCDHLYWGTLHDEFLFRGWWEILSSSTKGKAPYTPLYLVHMIAVCSVVGRIAAILLHVLLEQLLRCTKEV